MIAQSVLGVDKSYKNETIQLKFKVEAEKKKMSFTTHYFHTKTELDVDMDVSFPNKKISVAVSPSLKNCIEEITNNAYMQYQLK